MDGERGQSGWAGMVSHGRQPPLGSRRTAGRRDVAAGKRRFAPYHPPPPGAFRATYAGVATPTLPLLPTALTPAVAYVP